MQRRRFLQTLPSLAPLAGAAETGTSFPAVPALRESHFPSRLYQFVWRNWELANLDRMAAVVGGAARALDAMGRSMGLPAKPRLAEDYLKRIYITVIRQNWHLLPEEQIRQLLGWDRDTFAFTLKEDDFLDVKLGRVKPACEMLRYAAPSPEERQRAAEIARRIREWFPRELSTPAQARFAFAGELSRMPTRQGPVEVVAASGSEALRVAGKRFSAWTSGYGAEAGAVRRLHIAVEPARQAGYRIEVRGSRIGIRAASDREAIRALYRLRGEIEQRQSLALPAGSYAAEPAWSPRFVYSYFALYGDPLLEGEAAGLPDGYLDRAAACGVDAVWIQGVLNALAPSRAFPEFGKGWETRIANLRKLVERAESFGLRVILYLNEPRAMPAAFFRDREELRGTPYFDTFAMCTSAPRVREWLRESLAHVFRAVPALGGVFTITMSENHSNCFSHGGAWGDRYPEAKGCPRCSQRRGAEVIAEYVATVRDGVRAGSATAEVMSYDWGWGTPLAAELIPKLPKDTSVLSISEWSQPVERGGVRTAVGEYSMSVVGPGPRAKRNWELAREAGMRTIAKTQFNNTWEISAVPYIPVLPLVLDHCEALAEAGVDGTMASWTCGGYPSPNLRAANAYGEKPRPAKREVLRQEAERLFGAAGAPHGIRAWESFSRALQHFPYGVAIYVLPVQHGPANLLRVDPTGLKPGMILFPYDRYEAWRGVYPAATARRLLAELSAGWKEGLPDLEKAVAMSPPRRRGDAERELAIARTCFHHFASAGNQIEFHMLRDERATADGARRREIGERMAAIAQEEIALARSQFLVARGESTIGYEASNHYYYTPWDLVEKMLNCEAVLGAWRA
jgi:hypothetical protein